MNKAPGKGGDTGAEGRRLVALIMNRRLAKCLQERAHTGANCQACGVRQ